MYKVLIASVAKTVLSTSPYLYDDYTTSVAPEDESYTTADYFAYTTFVPDMETMTTPFPYDDDDDYGGLWVPTTSSPDTYWGNHYDVCRELCETFSAGGRGNGFDLCTSPQQSRCVYNGYYGYEICTNLYWSVTENGEDGLVYETDQASLTVDEAERPLTCGHAGDLVYGRPFDSSYPNSTTPYPYYIGMYDETDYVPPVTTSLNVALELFIHSAPGQRYLAEHAEDPRELAYHLHQYAINRTNVDIIRQYLNRYEISGVLGALTQLAVTTNTTEAFTALMTRNSTCQSCLVTNQNQQLGALWFGFRTNNQTIEFERFLSHFLNEEYVGETFCRSCHTEALANYTRESLDVIPEVLALSMRNHRSNYNDTGNISYPLQFNITNITDDRSMGDISFRLYAIAEGTDNSLYSISEGIDNSTAILRIGDNWFRTNGTGLVPIDAPNGPIVSGTNVLALYEQINPF